jgi:hypothetical protein
MSKLWNLEVARNKAVKWTLNLLAKMQARHASSP